MTRIFTSFLCLLLIVWLGHSTWFEASAIAISLYVGLTLLHTAGREPAILPLIGCIAAVELLLIPAVMYRVWPSAMSVESTVYFGFALPAFLAFYVGMRTFADGNQRVILQQIPAYLSGSNGCLALAGIGLTGCLVKLYWPSAPSLLSTLPGYCLFTAGLYAYYGQHPLRWLIAATAVGMLLVLTVQTGLFGELFFWLLLTVLLLAAGHSRILPNRAKLMAVGMACLFLLMVQSVKAEYRYRTWGGSRTERSGNAALLASLLADRLKNPDKLFALRHLVAASLRFNQGGIIGNAMNQVPVFEDYAGGEVMLALVHPFVPRLLWPGKPQTGGYENIRRFTNLRQRENTSMNLSPVGEGYVNFGYGGILFAGFYGLLLSGCMALICRLARTRPTLLLWLPMLFINCLTMETDLLSTWGSLVNGGLFVGCLYCGFHQLGRKL